jgi:hypothetical protein
MTEWFVYDVTTVRTWHHDFNLTITAALTPSSPRLKLFVTRNGKRRMTITSNVNNGCFDVRLWDSERGVRSGPFWWHP